MKKSKCLEIFELYILNKASDQDIDLLIRFINEDASINKWLEEQILNTSNDIDLALKLKMLDNIRHEIGRSEPKKAKFSIKKIFKVAASLLLPILILGGAYAYFQTRNNDENVQPLLVAVEAGEKANLVLPDGSKVWLNSDSKLTYYNNYNGKQRRLKLNGEAYFEVETMPEKPFVVECLDMKVEVLGTKFAIKAYDTDNIISTVLSSGKIRMTLSNDEFELKPNERVIYNRENKISTLTTVEANNFTEWRHNKLRFENETLFEISKTITRIYNIGCEFENPQIKDLRYTGTLDNTNLESVLKNIILTSPVKYRIDNGVIIFYDNQSMKHYFEN